MILVETRLLALADRAALLGIARRALLAHFGAGDPPPLPPDGPLSERRGAFVTLHAGSELRGCIGTFRAEATLAGTVAHIAVAAATEDPRFEPLAAAELASVRIGISALGLPRLLDDRSALRVGEHGILVRRGFHRGALLPHVALEHGWDAETFLKHACLKAGLPARAWAEPGTVVEVFDAEEFEEAA